MSTSSAGHEAGPCGGAVLVGLWAALADPYAAELCANSAFDWMLIDAEHGPNDVRTVLAQLQALAAYPVHPMVRLPNDDASLIKRYLDIGARNLLIPVVDTVEEAAAVVAATRYPPDGIRGVGAGLARASRWGARSDYLAEANDEVHLWVQLETTTALQNVEAIASLPGVDGVFFGPADIAASMGKLDKATDPDVVAAVIDGIERATAVGARSGVFIPDNTVLVACRNAGATLLGVAADTGMLAAATRRTAREMRELLGARVARLNWRRRVPARARTRA